jgi:hypothetical protein
MENEEREKHSEGSKEEEKFQTDRSVRPGALQVVYWVPVWDGLAGAVDVFFGWAAKQPQCLTFIVFRAWVPL